MKKAQYVSPSAVSVCIEGVAPLMVSGVSDPNSGDNAVKITKTATAASASTFETKGDSYSVWDDDWR